MIRRTAPYVVFVIMALMLSIGRIEAAFVSRMVAHGGVRKQLRIATTFHSSETNDGEDSSDDTQEVQPMRDTSQALLGGALRRAMETMATKSNAFDTIDMESTTQSIMRDLEAAIDGPDASSDKEQLQQSLRVSSNVMLQGAVGRAMRTMSTKATPVKENDSVSLKTVKALAGPDVQVTQEPSTSTADPYLTNPAITPTALAHQMWAHALRPNTDTAIDATCGNGNDSVAIASMLFNDNDDDPFTITEPQLICIDIQEEACETTRRRLSEMLHTDTMTCNVNVLCASHSPLPRPRDESSVGLVCYNLGYLPQSERTVLTQMETTISSIADAALLVRVGGIISVTTYPRSNKNEDYAVHALLEGLALLSSKTVDWRRDYVDVLGPDPDSSNADEGVFSVRDTVRTALERIVAEGPRKQTWRVLENKMLGRSLSPILLTATRIK